MAKPRDSRVATVKSIKPFLMSCPKNKITKASMGRLFKFLSDMEPDLAFTLLRDLMECARKEAHGDDKVLDYLRKDAISEVKKLNDKFEEISDKLEKEEK